MSDPFTEFPIPTSASFEALLIAKSVEVAGNAAVATAQAAIATTKAGEAETSATASAASASASDVSKTAAQTAASEAAAAVVGVSLNTQTGDYTLVLADAGKVILANSSSPLTVTIPPQASVTWAAGALITVAALGTGAVTVAAGSGVTIRSANSPPYSMPQYGTVALLRIAEDEWLLTGNIA